ncbi:hypothetical protein SAMN05421790_11638 [Kroppenstedtia eburnea]|uniref:Uncharacterized protein n=1 Tax=Kroppenstedtia eburnea TaxID=714067 RepID=A0A1N7PZS3_9BACL|nr:hypothetical protein SAMN05421790_11638 [Kroppenstedtia eburnea]
MRHKLKRKLLSLALGELVAVVSFCFCIHVLKSTGESFYIGWQTFMGLGWLTVILIQGSAYWLYKYLRIRNGRYYLTNRFFRALALSNFVFMISFPVITLFIVIFSNFQFSWSDFVLGWFLYLFSIGEYIHYFKKKVVMPPHERIRRKNNIPVPARIQREQ